MGISTPFVVRERPLHPAKNLWKWWLNLKLVVIPSQPMVRRERRHITPNIQRLW
jgi:hypothetical protein